MKRAKCCSCITVMETCLYTILLGGHIVGSDTGVLQGSAKLTAATVVFGHM